MVKKKRKPPKPLNRKSIKSKKSKCLWSGPHSEEGGISQSLLNKFMFCRERFRLKVIEGLQEQPEYSHYREYGQMWHDAEEAHAANRDWKAPVRKFATNLSMVYPDHIEEITKWHQLCRRQFPAYVSYWDRHPDVKGRTPMYQEHKFGHFITLPSGRKVFIRGMMDAVDRIKGVRKDTSGIFLQENKVKGEIKHEKIAGELPHNIQTMLYTNMLRIMGEASGEFDPDEVKGVRYNVIRRPLAFRCQYGFKKRKGRGKAQTGKETDAQYYDRIGETFKSDPGYWFVRWKVQLYANDWNKFNREVLFPLLEQVCDWWEWIIADLDNPFRPCADTGILGGGIHWRLPLGLYNPIAEGREGDYYDYLHTGDKSNLITIDKLFPELE